MVVSFFILIAIMLAYVKVHSVRAMGACVDIRRQLSKFSSLLPPSGPQEQKSDH